MLMGAWLVALMKTGMARICREAGARVKFNGHFWDMSVGVQANDGRQIEVLAQDLPCFVDSTPSGGLVWSGRSSSVLSPLGQGAEAHGVARVRKVSSRGWSPSRPAAGGGMKHDTKGSRGHHRSCATRPLWRGREGETRMLSAVSFASWNCRQAPIAPPMKRPHPLPRCCRSTLGSQFCAREQGDPLMLLLFSLGSMGREGERLVAFLAFLHHTPTQARQDADPPRQDKGLE